MTTEEMTIALPIDRSSDLRSSSGGVRLQVRKID